MLCSVELSKAPENRIFVGNDAHASSGVSYRGLIRRAAQDPSSELSSAKGDTSSVTSARGVSTLDKASRLAIFIRVSDG